MMNGTYRPGVARSQGKPTRRLQSSGDEDVGAEDDRRLKLASKWMSNPDGFDINALNGCPCGVCV